MHASTHYGGLQQEVGAHHQHYVCFPFLLQQIMATEVIRCTSTHDDGLQLSGNAVAGLKMTGLNDDKTVDVEASLKI
jgi:hypothetical protein